MVNVFFVLIANIQIVIQKRYERVLATQILKGSKKIGPSVKFEGPGIVYEKDKLEIGNHVFLGRNFFIRAAGGIKIGDYTHISRNVVLHTVNHNIDGELLPYDKKDVSAPIKIGKFVWIGMNACILPGVTIGDGAVIGMGAIISKDVSPGDVVVGPSQRVIKARNAEKVKNLVERNKFLKIESGK